MSFEFVNSKMNVFVSVVAAIIIVSFMLLLMQTEVGRIVESSKDAIKLKTEQLNITGHLVCFFQ